MNRRFSRAGWTRLYTRVHADYHRRYQVCGVQGLDEGADRRVERLGESSRTRAGASGSGGDLLADASLKHYGVMVSSLNGISWGARVVEILLSKTDENLVERLPEEHVGYVRPRKQRSHRYGRPLHRRSRGWLDMRQGRR